MTGYLIINGKDAYTEWGISLIGESLENLLLPMPAKEHITNKFRSENGERILMLPARYDSREVQLEFKIDAIDRADYLAKYEAFTQVLYANVFSIELPSIGKSYELIYNSSLSLGFYDHFGKLSVKFNQAK